MDTKRLKAARILLGMSQPEFGRLLGVNSDTVSRWETGKTPVPKTADMLLEWLVWEQKPDVPGYDWPEVPE